MKAVRVERLVRQIALTVEQEITCDECAHLSSQFVDAVLSGEDAPDYWASVIQHLEMCMPCSDEFKVLRECAKMELEGTWPSIEQLLTQACAGAQQPEPAE